MSSVVVVTSDDHTILMLGLCPRLVSATRAPVFLFHSWPAYINGGNESAQPFATFIEYGCNLWRNWHDIQCDWSSLGSIIDHWGDYGLALQPYAGPGHWYVSKVDPALTLGRVHVCVGVTVVYSTP